MAIQRQSWKVPIGDGKIRYRIIVTGEPCELHTREAREHQHLFMQQIAGNMEMLNCGFSIPERIVIRHNGLCWEAEAEAEIKE